MINYVLIPLIWLQFCHNLVQQARLLLFYVYVKLKLIEQWSGKIKTLFKGDLT